MSVSHGTVMLLAYIGAFGAYVCPATRQWTREMRCLSQVEVRSESVDGWRGV